MLHIKKIWLFWGVHFKLEIKIKSLRNSLAVPKSKATKVHRWHMCVWQEKLNFSKEEEEKRIREKTFGSCRKSHRMTKVMTLNEAKVWKKEKLEGWSLKKSWEGKQFLGQELGLFGTLKLLRTLILVLHERLL